MFSEIKVEVSWSPKNKAHYMSKGYEYTKRGDKFFVDISELPSNTSMRVSVPCDCCGNNFDAIYKCYRQNIENGNDILCADCRFKIRQEAHYKRVVEICREKGYELITKKEDIKDNQTLIEYVCPLHGLTSTKLTGLFVGKGCYSCGRMNSLKNKATTTLQERQDSLYSKALAVAEEKKYMITTSKENIHRNIDVIEYICPVHGSHGMRISNFISGRCCPDCSVDNLRELFKSSPDEVEEEIKSFGGKLLNKDDYTNNTTKNLEILCPECKEEIIVTSRRNFLQHGGQVCSNCETKGSSGERRIRHYLESNEILFEDEKWFDDCRDVKPLPFDFYLPDYNALIEFDGKQHYEDRGYKSGRFSDTLEYTQRHDKIKTNYCLSNNINLIRIPYWDYNNIESILDEQLNTQLYLHKDIV